MSNKKKIGIVTITNDSLNFGNRLQNYALQTVLERMGFHVETLNRPIRGNQRLWWRSMKKVLHYFIPFRRQISHLKAGNFYFWNRRYIKWSNFVATDDVLPSISNQYDYFVAGSDQIWNPKFPLFGEDPYMFLQFAKPEQRVAYAPSIGIDEISQESIPQYEDWWCDWRALSCREYTGANIISKVINKEVPTLIDPTLLLSREDWGKLTKGIKTPSKYIFVYMLGETTREYKEYIDMVANKYQCEIVDVMNDIRFAGCSPSHFVSLIQHAKNVLTDSYHAMIFSLIFHIPCSYFESIGREGDMSSRVDTIIEKFKMPFERQNSITRFTIEWGEFEKCLSENKYNAIQYLEHALN